MTPNFFNITIEFKSMKDLGNVYKLQLNGLEQIVGSMTEDDALREAELYLKNLLAIVKNRQELNWSSKQEK